MKNVTLKNVINFIITVLTAIASAFCVSSCRGERSYSATY